jgi:hypothetical protein
MSRLDRRSYYAQPGYPVGRRIAHLPWAQPDSFQSFF